MERSFYMGHVKFILLYIISLKIRKISYNYIIFHEGEKNKKYKMIRII